jgi:hypothetical protein
VGGIKNLGVATRLVSLWRLLGETAGQVARFGEWKPGGGIQHGRLCGGSAGAGGAAARDAGGGDGAERRAGFYQPAWIARWVKRALISFGETARFFPPGRTELTGLPVREEFFNLPPRSGEDEFTVLITGGSQGSRTLNEAARQSWPLFREAGLPVRLIHQTGAPMYETIAAEFRETGLAGESRRSSTICRVRLPSADLIVCRSGRGRRFRTGGGGETIRADSVSVRSGSAPVEKCPGAGAGRGGARVARPRLDRAKVFRDRA